MEKLAIHSVPRSGSTYLGALFAQHPRVEYRFQPLFSYTHKSQLTPNSNALSINKFYDDILHTKDEFVLQYKYMDPDPSGTKTHLAYKEVRYHNILENMLRLGDVKVIGLTRDPADVIESWYNAPKEFRSDLGWKIEDEWFEAPSKNLGLPEEFNGFKKWLEVFNLFESLERKYPESFIRVSYEDIIKSKESIVQIFKWVGLDFKESMPRNNLNNRNDKDPYSVNFRGRKSIDNYKPLPEEIKRKIKSLSPLE